MSNAESSLPSKLCGRRTRVDHSRLRSSTRRTRAQVSLDGPWAASRKEWDFDGPSCPSCPAPAAFGLAPAPAGNPLGVLISDEHTYELPTLMRISYADSCLINNNMSHTPIYA